MSGLVCPILAFGDRGIFDMKHPGERPLLRSELRY